MKYAIPRLGYAVEDGYSANPAAGASIGLSGGRNSATLGGYVRLRLKSAAKGEETIYMGITCHHVVSSQYSPG